MLRGAVEEAWAAAGVHTWLVYIDEAHAQDRWPVSSARFVPDGKPVRVNAPTTWIERRALATVFHQQYGWPAHASHVLVDDMDNSWGQRLAGWPMRAYLWWGTKLVHASEPLGANVNLEGFLRDAQAYVDLSLD